MNKPPNAKNPTKVFLPNTQNKKDLKKPQINNKKKSENLLAKLVND